MVPTLRSRTMDKAANVTARCWSKSASTAGAKKSEIDGWMFATLFVSLRKGLTMMAGSMLWNCARLAVQIREVLVDLIEARQPLVARTWAVAQLIGVLAQVGEHTLHLAVVSCGSALLLLHTVQ